MSTWNNYSILFLDIPITGVCKVLFAGNPLEPDLNFNNSMCDHDIENESVLHIAFARKLHSPGTHTLNKYSI